MLSVLNDTRPVLFLTSGIARVVYKPGATIDDGLRRVNVRCTCNNV